MKLSPRLAVFRRGRLLCACLGGMESILLVLRTPNPSVRFTNREKWPLAAELEIAFHSFHSRLLRWLDHSRQIETRRYYSLTTANPQCKIPATEGIAQHLDVRSISTQCSISMTRLRVFAWKLRI